MPKFRMMVGKGLLQIFMALLLVAFVMLASNYLVFKNSVAGIYDQVSENNKLVLKQMLLSFDESFKSINNLMYALSVMPYKPWDSSGKTNMYEVYLTQKNMGGLVSSMDFIEETVLFVSGTDMGITPGGSVSLQYLFASKYQNDVYNSDYWKSFADAKRPMRIFPMQVYNERTTDHGVKRRNLIMVMGNNQLSIVHVMLIIDEEKLLNHVNQMAMAQDASLIVADQDQNVILNTDPDWNFADTLGDIQAKAGKESTYNLKGYDYRAIKSEYNGFTYIYKMPYQFANMKPVIRANRLIMTAAIVCALVLSALLSLYLYKPIREIRMLIGGRPDFRSLRSGIVRIQQENETIREQMNYFQSEIRRGALLHAIDDVPYSREFERRMQQFFDGFFQTEQFLMVAFHFYSDGGHAGDVQVDIAHMERFIQNELRKGLENVEVYYSGELRFLAMIGLGSKNEKPGVLAEIRSFMKKAKSETGGFEIFGAVSLPYQSRMQNCYLAYQDLKHGMLYRQIDPENRLVDMETIQYTWKVYLPFEEMEKLTNALARGEDGECERIVTEILATNELRGIRYRQSEPIAKCLMLQMLTYLEMSGAAPKDIVALETEVTRKIDRAANYQVIREALTQLILTISERRNHAPKTKLDPTSIAQYIDRNYMENLHLDHMAELLETSPKYFSNYFKRSFGVNFVDYLNRVRLSHAKGFLKLTDWSVTEISEKTGYSNPTTFTSTFKKYNGISPSEYRKQAAE